jgi:hypothetical protein
MCQVISLLTTKSFEDLMTLQPLRGYANILSVLATSDPDTINIKQWCERTIRIELSASNLTEGYYLYSVSKHVADNLIEKLSLDYR